MSNIEEYRDRLDGLRNILWNGDGPVTDSLLALIAEIVIDLLEAQTVSARMGHCRTDEIKEVPDGRA